MAEVNAEQKKLDDILNKLLDQLNKDANAKGINPKFLIGFKKETMTEQEQSISAYVAQELLVPMIVATPLEKPEEDKPQGDDKK